MTKDDNKNKVSKIKISTFLYGISVFFIVVIFIFVIFIYRLGGASKVPDFVSKNIFLPAVILDGKNWISMGDLSSNLFSIKRFYSSQDFSSLGYRIDFETEDGKKRLKVREKELINKMIEDSSMEILAKERKIKVSNKMVDSNVERKLDEYGSRQAVGESLDSLYGWSLDDFKNKIVKPSLYKDELEKWLEENDGEEQKIKSKKDADLISKKIKDGDDFDSLSLQVSENGGSETGDRLGWFKKDQITKEIRGSVLKLKKGEVSDVLESKMGYHIIKLNDTNNLEGEDILDISQIFFPKMSFATWLEGKIKDMSVMIPLVEYKWNKESGLVEFKDKKMEDFENNSLYERGDASIEAL